MRTLALLAPLCNAKHLQKPSDKNRKLTRVKHHSAVNASTLSSRRYYAVNRGIRREFN